MRSGSTIRGFFRRRLACERGFALILSIGVATSLGITGATVAAYSVANYGGATRSKADQLALTLAEAGLNNALATLHSSSSPTMDNAVPQQAASLEGGTATWYGTLQGDVWTLTGIGRVRNPVGSQEAQRQVSARVRLGSSTQGTGNNAIWNYVYSDDPNGCMSLANSVTVNIPLYVRGSLCMANSAGFTGYALQVAGTVSLENSSQIGVSQAAPGVHEVHVGGGCRLGSSGPFTTPCGAPQRVYAEVAPDANVAPLTKPPVDLAGWYQNAKPGPMQNCTSGSFPGGFDNDGLLNRSRAAVDLTPSSAYDCQVRDAQGNLRGQIAWTPGGPGTLTVAGTIFFDGDITFKNSTDAVYEGKATIYASGKILMRNSTKLCGIAGCGSGWDANQNLLAFVAGGSTDADGFKLENSTVFQGASYAVNDYREENSVVVWGPIIARQVYLQNSSSNHYVPIGTLLPGMPATYEEAITLANEPGSWSS